MPMVLKYPSLRLAAHCHDRGRQRVTKEGTRRRMQHEMAQELTTWPQHGLLMHVMQGVHGVHIPRRMQHVQATDVWT